MLMMFGVCCVCVGRKGELVVSKAVVLQADHHDHDRVVLVLVVAVGWFAD